LWLFSSSLWYNDITIVKFAGKKTSSIVGEVYEAVGYKASKKVNPISATVVLSGKLAANP